MLGTDRPPSDDPRYLHRLLRTYIGPDSTLASAACNLCCELAKTGLLPERLRQLLGYSSISDVLPYMALVGGDVDRQMSRGDLAFQRQVALDA